VGGGVGQVQQEEEEKLQEKGTRKKTISSTISLGIARGKEKWRQWGKDHPDRASKHTTKEEGVDKGRQRKRGKGGEIAAERKNWTSIVKALGPVRRKRHN